MVTQLQDIANQVAQEKISNSRLRNEEIRRQMTKPWSEPVQPTTKTYSLQNATKGDKTLAGTYSALLNNWQGMSGGDSIGDTFNRSYKGSTNPLGLPSWTPTAVGTGLSMAGMGAPVSALGSAATSLVRGDRAGAGGTLANLFTNTMTGGKIPGLGGLAGTLASGIIGDKSTADIGKNLVNSGLGTLFSMTNPVAGLGYNLARMLGLDIARGVSDYSQSDISQRFDAGYQGGFWGGSGRGSWEPTAPYSPTGTYSGSGYGNTVGPGSGGDSSSSGYSTTESYSNPASSYGSW